MKMHLIVLLLLTSFSCKKQTELLEYKTVTIQYKKLTGVKDNLLSLDVYYKDQTSSKPVVIYVHGGGWAIGDKTQSLDNKISLFNEMDYVFVSVNYRLSPFPYKPNDANRIKYPDHNNDVAYAIKMIYDNIHKYGGNNQKMVLFGHSAGAQIVSLTGVDKSFLEARGLSLDVLKGIGIIDTKGFDVTTLVAYDNNTQEMYINGFGENATENDKASPIKHIASGLSFPKVFITVRGSELRKAAINEFIDKMNDSDLNITIVDGSIYSHSEINDAIGKTNETTITNPFKAFLVDCFN